MSQDSILNNTPQFDEDFLEWEERDDSIPYLTHCLGTLS